MNDRKGFFVRRSRAVVSFAVGIILTCAGSAWAADCTIKQPEPGLDAPAESQWGGATVAADDRQKIDDLFSRYAWALDQRDADRFENLFTGAGSYEVCTGEGNIQIYIAPKAVIKMTLQQQFDETKDVFQPRHVVINTLLRSRKDHGKTFLDSKSTMAVTVQRAEGDRVLPEPDYTADVRATLDKDKDTGVWRFATVTVYADTPEFEPMGR
ncbi:nuclear transport factor 2 family protein [Mesorhizobium sp. M0768]|uniref:nuclear transport factor 2 family protein n=1 Tax=Mesorhizobium sp. M0768 TaxID=2956996 RepID=UPI00333961FB